MVLEVGNIEEFEKQLSAAGSNAVIVDFFATWCGPCKVIAPMFAEWAQKTPTVVVLKVDVDQGEDIAAKYEITAMPTFLVFKNGKVVETVVGGDSAKVEALFAKYK